MKVKIDENLPAEIAEDLRVLGHDAMTVVEQGMSGVDDELLMARVEDESRIFMTMDKGIANIQAYAPGRFAGLILFRPNQRRVAGKCCRSYARG
jgi:predicted nuclease of predicted toxin-antitoxin system